MAVYFGGSRSLSPAASIPLVVRAVLAAGQSIHVGCQSGADQQVIQSAMSVPCKASFLVVFAQAPQAGAPSHVLAAKRAGHLVHFQAGGAVAPVPAQFLLRSLAGLAGCSAAVFFWPGHGSLAVSTHAVHAGQPVFAFGPCPQPVPGCSGSWVPGSFLGFSCWQWQPAAVQPALF